MKGHPFVTLLGLEISMLPSPSSHSARINAYHICENEESYATTTPNSPPLGNMYGCERKHQQSICRANDSSRQNIPEKGIKSTQS
jgi:hypothetical protein